MIVTASGLMPQRLRSLANGVRILVNAARAYRLSISGDSVTAVVLAPGARLRLGEAVDLTLGSRLWRLAVSALVVAGVAAGTLVGDDQWWPMAPMSQYAFAVKTDGGVINSPYMEAVTTAGDRVPVDLSREALGIERSEIEGQLGSIVADPSKLQAVAVLHHRRQPDAPRWQVVEVRNTKVVLGDTREESDELLARWTVRHPQDPEQGL